MRLIVVESPTKAKTISRYLGKGYEVMASAGHIRDLPKSPLSIDVDKDYEPTYIIPETKQKVVNKLISAAKKASQIVIATDLDREGEAIGHHIKWIIDQELKDKKKKPEFVRATFHEITKEAVMKSINNPGEINNNLVNAQQARRVLDRLVGYKLSPVLWKKVRRFLSAGRVQSVAVKLVVEKEDEINKFKPEEYWEIGADVFKKGAKKDQFRIDLYKIKNEIAKVTNGKQAGKIVSDLKKASYQVTEMNLREVSSSPMPPFITSTMQRTAANVLGWSSKQTMRLAQQLYEHGYITYHRTDSVFLSSQALIMSRKYIEEKYGKEYLPENPRFFKTKSKLAQEAHEAVRVTKADRNFDLIEEKCGSMGKRLYQLILNRFIASQMADARVSKTTILVSASKDYLLRAMGEVQVFDGWRKVNGKEVEAVILPQVNQGDSLDLVEVLSFQKFTKPPARYTESTLIKALEQREIGRPSTYAPTISTILGRRYIEKEERNLIPTAVGITVTKFLEKYFAKIMDYEFTAKIENELDEIASGKIKWIPMIDEFYKPFIKNVLDVEKNAERVQVPVEKTGKKCPKCKKGDVIIRTGRFGKFYACDKFPDCDWRENYVEKAGMKCPTCGKGDVIMRKTKKGRQFFGCSEYPKCEWASWNNPMVKKKN